MLIAIDSNQDRENVRASKMRHVLMVVEELMEHKKKQSKAKLFPQKFCSVILDGVDQLAFAWPHFLMKAKVERCRALKICLKGLVEHKRPANLYL